MTLHRPRSGDQVRRGGATSFQQDLANADCIVIMGSNMAEAHPVGFQWVVEAKARGAKVIHVDPRFTRTSASPTPTCPSGRQRHRLPRRDRQLHPDHELDFREYVVGLHQRRTDRVADFRDTEDLDGLFSGFDPRARLRTTASWMYQGRSRSAARHGHRGAKERRPAGCSTSRTARAGQPQTERDATLRHPRCVYQILKRHFARYTPEMVERACGVPREKFERVAEAWTENSGRERTTALVYAVGWTQHSVGVQYIRTGAIIQLLLGNIGRPGRRDHGDARPRQHPGRDRHPDPVQPAARLPADAAPRPACDLPAVGRQHPPSRSEGLLGQRRDVRGEPAQGVLGRRRHGRRTTTATTTCPGSPATTAPTGTVLDMIDGKINGYFLLGQNPAVGSAHGKAQRLGMANLDWLVVRDLFLIESATSGRTRPEVATGEIPPEACRTEVFFLPAASHVEKEGTFTQTQRMLQWRDKAVDPPGDSRSDLWFFYHLGRILKERWPLGATRGTGPVLDLTWDYPVAGEDRTSRAPSRAARDQRLRGRDRASGASSLVRAAGDGSTACGCWIYSGVFADGVNQAARRKPRRQQAWVAGEWGWAWPANRRILYNRAAPTPTDARGPSARPTSGGTRGRPSGSATTSRTSRRQAAGRTARPRTRRDRRHRRA